MQQLKKDLLKVIKKHQCSYYQLTNAMKDVYKLCENLSFYDKPKKKKKLPQLPSMDQIKELFKEIKKLNPTHKLWNYILYTTGIRVEELVNIKLSDINYDEGLIYINEGKGSKDRYAILLSEINEMLKIYVHSNNNSQYLFENKLNGNKPYSIRRVEQIVKGCKDKAGINFRVSPHSYRHLLLTYLTKMGWNTAALMKVSGHENANSLKIYQHLDLTDIIDSFRESVGNNFRLAIAHG